MTTTEASGRESILDCACTLFAKGGFAGTSMRSLARAAHTSQALIHHHFGTKAGLYRAVRDRLMSRLADSEILSSALRPSTDPVTDLATSMTRYADFLQANPEFLRLSTWARLEGDDDPWAGPEDLLGPMADALRELQRIGQLRADLDVTLHMVFVGGIVEHWVSHQRLFVSTFEPDEDLHALSARYFAQTASVIANGALARPEPS